MSFPQKKKKIKPKSNHKNRKECHEDCTIFHCIAFLHTKPAFTAFQDKSYMHLHPKNHIHVKCIDFSYIPISQIYILFFEFGMRGPFRELISCFLIRLSPLVLEPVCLFQGTQSPHNYLIKDYHGLLCLKDYQVHWHAETIKVFSLFLKTSMSFDKDYHNLLCLRDYQVRWLAETIMVICFLYIFKTIKIYHHAETIKVICLYFSKTIHSLFSYGDN